MKGIVFFNITSLRFYPSKVYKLIQSILDENLKDVEYEGTKAPALTE